MIWLSLLAALSLHAEEIKFEKVELKIGNVAVHAQIADDEEKREHGLMFVKSMPANDGMLFVFEEEQSRAFWMKNTLIPLALGYFDSTGKLLEVLEMVPAQSLMEKNPPTYPSSEPATLALEMNKGWFKKNHLGANTKICLVGAAKSALLKQKVPTCSRQTSSDGSAKTRQTGD